MRLPRFRSTWFFAVVLVAAIVVAAVGINAGETPKSVRIIYTNDTQGYLEPCG